MSSNSFRDDITDISATENPLLYSIVATLQTEVADTITDTNVTPQLHFCNSALRETHFESNGIQRQEH